MCVMILLITSEILASRRFSLRHWGGTNTHYSSSTPKILKYRTPINLDNIVKAAVITTNDFRLYRSGTTLPFHLTQNTYCIVCHGHTSCAT